MKRRHLTGRAAGPAAVLAVAGLLIAGCSSGSPSGSGGSQAGTSSKTGGSGGSGSGSGGSGGGQASGGGTTTTSGSPLFPVAVGEKWVYADHLGALGSATTVNTIKSVKPTSGGNLVTMTDANDIGGPAAKTTKITYLFHSDGSIGVPFTQAGNGTVTIKSGSIVWPPAAAIASGQAHTSVLQIAIKEGGQTLNEKVHVTVKGGGTQSVTVPAGTYQATVVDETMTESILGHHVSLEIRTWLAPGVGPVQSELVDSSPLGGGMQVREELKSFTK